jgi:hypothetical protein
MHGPLNVKSVKKIDPFVQTFTNDYEISVRCEVSLEWNPWSNRNSELSYWMYSQLWAFALISSFWCGPSHDRRTIIYSFRCRIYWKKKWCWNWERHHICLAFMLFSKQILMLTSWFQNFPQALQHRFLLASFALSLAKLVITQCK